VAILTPKFVSSSEIVCSKHINDMGRSWINRTFTTHATLVSRLYRFSTYEHYTYEHVTSENTTITRYG